MKEYKVIAEFVNRETGDRVKAGDTISADDDRAEALRVAGVIGKEVQPESPDESQLVSLGGGYYQLPNGDKVQGKDKALEALKDLEALKQAENGATPSAN